MRKLTEKQKRFADYYIELGNAEEAAKRAGYSARGNTTKLLQNTTIREYIQQRLSEKDKERIASQDEILAFLTKVLRGEETEKIPMAGKDFFELVENTPNIKDRIKAAELLGKRFAMWTERQQVDANFGVQIIDDVGGADETD
ncbi:terminase small subunit [Anoxybacteroides amylolyticum]|uniref:Terminase small subunit n=1 Tax=Anoxybacteroides amylolyticum TaxID=294699 RepID=A0A160F6S9_9BACL|nr:terminase small subunit [Anoxybacillus amylolyticus]ANB62329.1 terminase small subunit [Anoxybacillus amylolyticus]